jgi:hypothetical protein
MPARELHDQISDQLRDLLLLSHREAAGLPAGPDLVKGRPRNILEQFNERHPQFVRATDQSRRSSYIALQSRREELVGNGPGWGEFLPFCQALI